MQDDEARPLLHEHYTLDPVHLVSKLAGASASEGTSTACTSAGATAGESCGAAPSGAAAPSSAAAQQHGAEMCQGDSLPGTQCSVLGPPLHPQSQGQCESELGLVKIYVCQGCQTTR